MYRRLQNIGKILLALFAYPVACIAIRFLLRPFIWRWLKSNFNCSDAVSDYVTNYACFVAISVEVFTILFVNGLVKNVTIILLVDTVVLIGMLLIGCRKQQSFYRGTGMDNVVTAPWSLRIDTRMLPLL